MAREFVVKLADEVSSFALIRVTREKLYGKKKRVIVDHEEQPCQAALLTRGMMEMARYGRLHGAQAATFFGLAGIGDLVTTCCSRHSRNRSVGEAIGRGEKLQDILERMTAVAEGVWTTKALFGPEAELGGVEMPIAAEVHAVLFEGKDPREAVLDLMRREPVSEMGSLA